MESFTSNKRSLVIDAPWTAIISPRVADIRRLKCCTVMAIHVGEMFYVTTISTTNNKLYK